MIKAPVLQPGDVVGICAPSSPVDAAELQAAVKEIEGWGLRVRLGDHVEDCTGFLAGTDDDRLADLNTLIAVDEVKGIICARGGYGAIRLLDFVDYAALARKPKAFVGFSDITALHLAIQRKTGLVTFHGPMATANPDHGMRAFNAEGLRTALMSRDPLGVVPHPDGVPRPKCLYGGRASGRIVGGNLSLIAATMGTPYEIQTDGAILFLEDVDEAPYRVDRMLTQLLLAGKLQSAAAIVIGEMRNCETDPNRSRHSFSLERVLEERLTLLGKPVLYGVCCGHGPYRVTLPLGAHSSLDADAGVWRVEEPALI